MNDKFKVLCKVSDINVLTKKGNRPLFKKGEIYDFWHEHEGVTVKESWGVDISFTKSDFNMYFEVLDEEKLLEMFVKDLQHLSDQYGLYVDANFTKIKDKNYKPLEGVTLVLECVPCEYVLDKPNGER